MKISENPDMKARELVMVRYRIFLLSVPSFRSSNEMPVIKDTYEGTRGSTQGERKENTPAKNARGKETSFMADHFPMHDDE